MRPWQRGLELAAIVIAAGCGVAAQPVLSHETASQNPKRRRLSHPVLIPGADLQSDAFHVTTPTQKCYPALAVCCCNSDESRKTCKG